MSDSFNIYVVPVDAFNRVLAGLTDTGKSVFRSYFRNEGTLKDGKSVVYAIDDDAFSFWRDCDDETDYDGDGEKDIAGYWLWDIGESLDVSVLSGSIGGDPISG